jgi:hypothetical protein
MAAVQSVEVNQQNQTSAFQIVLRARRTSQFSPDYSLVSSPLLQPGSRVVIMVTIGAAPRVLMDGIITLQQLSPDPNGEPLLTVTGQDISVLMDLYEIPMEYPALGDTEIAFVVLAKYLALGILPQVVPTPTSFISLPIESIPQQSGTDRQYLQSLAARHGYIFFVRPALTPLANTAYWGPLSRAGLPQKTLNIDQGPATNVEGIQFSYDALAPVQVFGAVSDADLEVVIPVVTFASTRLPPLASRPALMANQPFVRKSMLDYQGSSWIEAQAQAQSITDQSTDNVVTAQGRLNVLRYGDILTAPGLVGLRGAGFSYDGLYYVKSVSHQIALGQYTQSFTLAREGTGTLVNGVMP